MKLNSLMIILLVSTMAYSQADCKKFKTGKFQNIENGVIKSVIQRNDSIQLESSGKREVKLKITWIDNCTYKLKFIWGNDAFWNGRPKNMPTPDLVVTITKTDGNQYWQEAQSEGEDFIYKSVLIKME